jgi:hypothetical protein
MFMLLLSCRSRVGANDSISIDDIKSAKTGKIKSWDGVDYAVKRD